MIGGENVELTSGGNFLIHIESIFKSAGMIYNFSLKSSGISFNQAIVEAAKNEKRHIVVTIGDNQRKYIISPEKIINIVNTFGSVYKTKNGMNLFVVPLRELKALDDGMEQKSEKMKIDMKEAITNKLCPNCNSSDLDFANSKFYVVCGGCGKIYSKSIFVKK
jgi:ribosomal protein S27E